MTPAARLYYARTRTNPHRVSCYCAECLPAAMADDGARVVAVSAEKLALFATDPRGVRDACDSCGCDGYRVPVARGF